VIRLSLLLITLLIPLPTIAITGIDFNALPYNEKGAYIIGIDDGLSFMGASCTQNGPKTYEQALTAVTNFMKAHPDREPKNMADIYAEAIITTFDCEKNPKIL
jgi:hypothetical protein